MRWLMRILLIGAALVGSWLQFMPAELPGTFFGQRRDALKMELAARSVISMGYVAPTDRWLSVPLDKGSTQIRLVSTASVVDLAAARAARREQPNRRWNYALEYEILDRAGARILHRVHHHRTDLSLFRLPDGREFTPNFHLDESLTPLTGVIVLLNTAGMAEAGTLRLRLVQKDPDLHDVLVRVYVPEKVASGKIPHLWQRMSEPQKEALARGSVYNHELLLETEKFNLLAHAWRPQGPSGIRGRDFRARELYVLRDNDGEVIDEAVPPAGLVADAQHWATLPVPPQGGTLRLRFAATATAVPASGPIRLRWSGPSAFQRRQIELPWQSAGVTHELKLEGGLLEIEPPQEMVIRAFLLEANGQETEITPPPAYLRTFVADALTPVEYAVAHAGSRPTPFRAVFRSLQPEGADDTPQVRYEILTDGDSILKSGVIALKRPASRHERLVGDDRNLRLHEGAEYFFLLPTTVRKIRFFADSTARETALPVLVSAQTRAADLPRQSRVPEDYFDFAALGERVPGWFALRPLGYEALIVENRSRLLTLQARPPHDRPELSAGRFQSEEFRPHGHWLGRHLLVPREPGVPVRPEALPALFTPLRKDGAQTLEFPPHLGSREITPVLAWNQAGATGIALEVEIDGRHHARLQARQDSGALLLPPLAAGRHTLRLRGQGAERLFINHVTPAPDSRMQRFGLLLDRQLVFPITRSTRCEEFITLRLHQPAGTASTRLRIRVTPLRAPLLEPLPWWIFEEREVDISPDRSFALPVFEQPAGRVDTGQPVFLAFPAGAPTGEYQVQVSVIRGQGGLLTATRLSTQLRPERRIQNESGVLRVHVTEP